LKEIEKLNEALFDLKGISVIRIFISGCIIRINFSNQTNIKASSYSYIDKNDIKYSTLKEANIKEKTFMLLEDCAFDLTLKIQEEYESLQEDEWKEKEKSQEIGDKLSHFLEKYQGRLTVDKIKCINLSKFIISFREIDNFSIEFYSNKFYPNVIDIETKNYDFLITKDECRITSVKVEKDYTSFSSVAKSRFKIMAKELGYEQITGTIYVKKREGWYETFNLQLSSGNPFFYINYGVELPEKFPMRRDEIKNSSYHYGERLCPKDSGAFPAGNKKQIEESATLALELYKEKVVPWFESLTLEKVKKEINK